MANAWQFEVTADKLARLQLELEWALQRQNQRFSSAMPAQRMSLGARRLLVLGIALVLGATSLTMRGPNGHLDAWGTFGIVLAGFAAVMALSLPRVRAWSKRTAGTMLARRARRLMRPAFRNAPYTIVYQLGSDELTADAAGTVRVLPLARSKRVIATPGLLVAFRRTRSLVPMWVLYIGEQRDAEIAALRERLVACETVTGPVDGYAPAVPEARVR